VSPRAEGLADSVWKIKPKRMKLDLKTMIPLRVLIDPQRFYFEEKLRLGVL
jgi:hypothetical protein